MNNHTIDRALDETEANLHDVGTHPTATLVALGVLALEDKVSVRAHYRARAILSVTGGTR
jgi:hypothetical protein